MKHFSGHLFFPRGHQHPCQKVKDIHMCYTLSFYALAPSESRLNMLVCFWVLHVNFLHRVCRLAVELGVQKQALECEITVSPRVWALDVDVNLKFQLQRPL